MGLAGCVACTVALCKDRSKTRREAKEAADAAQPPVADAAVETESQQASRQHLKGTLIVFFGVLWLTPDSLLIKLVASDGGWETMFWRHVFYASTMTIGLLAHAAWWTPRAEGDSSSCLPRAARIWCSRIRATERYGVFWLLVQVPANVGFIIGQSHTTAANVLIVVATCPLWSALFSRLFLSEPIPL